MRSPLVLACLALSSAAWSQSYLLPHQFHQFREFSGLPGAGFGVMADGSPGILGALAFSTPIGICLTGNTFDLGLDSRSYDNFPKFINTRSGSNNSSEGTGQVLVGLGTPVGNFTGGYEVVSSEFDQVYNAQWQLPLHLKDGGVSFGVQNITNREEGGPTRANRSFFGAASYEVAKGDWLTVGVGDVRFHGVFGSASAMIYPRLKAMTEYDTFSFNPGLAYSFGKVKGLGEDYDRNEVTLFFGYVRAQFATVGLNWAF